MRSIIQGEQRERPFCHRMVISAFNRWPSFREMLMKTFYERPHVMHLKIPEKITVVRFENVEQFDLLWNIL